MKGNWAAYEERNRELGNLSKKTKKETDRVRKEAEERLTNSERATGRGGNSSSC